MKKADFLKMMAEQEKQERKEFKEYTDLTDYRVLDLSKASIEPLAKDEIFVLVNGTRNYWVSNHGRLVNNLRNGYYMHNTKSENNKKKSCSHHTLTGYTADNEMINFDAYIDKLVAERFLYNPMGYDRVWHIDRDLNNNYYKNLVYVDYSEYLKLFRNVITVDDLGREQEYNTYVNINDKSIYTIWHGIYNRCYVNGSPSYDGSTMCDKWLNDKDSIKEWYASNIYVCDGESMAIDKDLLFPGNKVYSPETCCILPQTLNTMLSNCRKHRLPEWKKSEMELPLGVRYNKSKGMYYAEITPCGYDKPVKLAYKLTADGAFYEYKKFKEADIKVMALKYKDKIPDRLFWALINYKVQPH